MWLADGIEVLGIEKAALVGEQAECRRSPCLLVNLWIEIASPRSR
jgi:hypothetical protein